MTNEILHKPIDLQGLSLAVASLKTYIDSKDVKIEWLEPDQYDSNYYPTIYGNPNTIYVVLGYSPAPYTYAGDVRVGDTVGTSTIESISPMLYVWLWDYYNEVFSPIGDTPASNEDIENMLGSIGFSAIEISSGGNDSIK